MSTVITNPEELRLFNMVAQKKALQAELKGFKFSKGSVYAHVKRQYNLRGSKQSVYTQFCELVECKKQELGYAN